MVHYRALILAAAVLLAGCAATPPPFVAGHPILTPPQWIDFCARHPTDAGCRK